MVNRNSKRQKKRLVQKSRSHPGNETNPQHHRLKADDSSRLDDSIIKQEYYGHDISIRTSSFLQFLSNLVDERVQVLKKNSHRGKKPYLPNALNPSGTSTKKRKRVPFNDSVQPRSSDYGGIGLARPSLWIPLNDPSSIPRIQEEFAEHIPGFYGKQRTKAMKKQLNKKMIWRQMTNKNEKEKLLNQKVNGRKLSDMNPDERVLAMMKAGMI
jgi:hypothetical protein